MTKLTVKEVLDNVNQMLMEYENYDGYEYIKKYYFQSEFSIDKVYGKLNIFDWWVEYLSIAKLKDMKKFLEEAIKLGYTGTCSFKVGAPGCSNGMWAFKEGPTEDGYDPKGDAIYKSFTPAYNYWNIKKNGEWYPKAVNHCENYDKLTTIRKFENYIINELEKEMVA